MTLIGAPQLQAKLGQLEQRLNTIPKTVAAESVPDVAQAVRGDIGDDSMSGWTTKKGALIHLRAMLDGGHMTNKGEAAIVPVGRQTGMFRVLQQGRNAEGGAGGYQGPGISPSGTPIALNRIHQRRRRRTRRYNGQTAGKGTWSDAQQLIQQSLGKRSAKALHEVMRATFKGGG